MIDRQPIPSVAGLRPTLTRRALIGAAAGVVGATLLQRAPETLALSRRVFATALGPLGAISGMHRAPRPFVLLGVQWQGPRTATVQLRVQRADGKASRWFDASPRHGGVAEPIWTGVAEGYELRTSAPLSAVTIHFVAGGLPVAGAAGGAASPPRFQAGPGQPPIVPRGAWATAACAPRTPPSFGEIALAFVHHTAGVNAYGPGESEGIVQAICLFHRNVNGWNDIGYNFLVDRYGQIFEGRKGGIDEPVVGAHAGGFNHFSTGVSIIGDFTSELPPRPALRALDQLLAWKLALHGVPTRGRASVRVDPAGALYSAFQPGRIVSLPRVAGHRDGDQTDCPGNRLYADLPALRPRIAALAGPALELIIAISAPSGARTVTAPGPATASGFLRELGGAPLVGAPIEVQQRHEAGGRTIARTATAVDGSWRVALTLRENATLRAVHRPAPAVISRAVHVAVAPAITLALASGTGAGRTGRIAVTGTLLPTKPAVIVDLYATRNGTRRTLISRTRVPVANGSFATSVPARRGGTYQLVAHTRADAANAAGSSHPIGLTN